MTPMTWVRAAQNHALSAAPPKNSVTCIRATLANASEKSEKKGPVTGPDGPSRARRARPHISLTVRRHRLCSCNVTSAGPPWMRAPSYHPTVPSHGNESQSGWMKPSAPGYNRPDQFPSDNEKDPTVDAQQGRKGSRSSDGDHQVRTGISRARS